MYDKALNTPDVEFILIKYEKSLPFFATVKTLQKCLFCNQRSDYIS